MIANVLPPDSFSKKLRNGLYRAMGADIGQGSAFAGGGYLNVREKLTIGERSFINRGCYFDLSAPITIGNDVSIGTHCVFVTANHEMGPATRRAGAVCPEAIVVSDGVWIGTRVTVLPGVTIGRGAVICSGAVVTRSVPDNILAAQVPAVVKRSLEAGAPIGFE